VGGKTTLLINPVSHTTASAGWLQLPGKGGQMDAAVAPSSGSVDAVPRSIRSQLAAYDAQRLGAASPGSSQRPPTTTMEQKRDLSSWTSSEVGGWCAQRLSLFPCPQTVHASQAWLRVHTR
jgi:hypothetical protein